MYASTGSKEPWLRSAFWRPISGKYRDHQLPVGNAVAVPLTDIERQTIVICRCQRRAARLRRSRRRSCSRCRSIVGQRPRRAVLLASEALDSQGSGVFPRRGENTMRKTAAFASVAFVAAIVWGATVIVANSPREASVRSASIDVMQMMRDARNLPEQQFDAY